jgi:MFS family permease
VTETIAPDRAPRGELRPSSPIDGRTAWIRLAAALVISTIGGVGMWGYIVALPTIQADLGITRAAASLPYTLTMIGFAAGSAVMGFVVDRRGLFQPLLGAIILLSAGFVLASVTRGVGELALMLGLLVAMLGASITFAPLLADVSLWFARRRGIAIALVACGNYLAGAIWPLVLRPLIDSYGWRATFSGVGVFCLVSMLPLALVFRRPPPSATLQAAAAPAGAALTPADLGINPNALMALIMIAGVACCVAMSMPQVHIVAYCGDLGYGVARGAEMLSLMLGFGVVSRIASGLIADRIGGLKTLLLGSVLQGIALLLYVPFDGLASLYIVSALFGLFQGGIVPSYALIVRDYFRPQEAASRVGLAMMSTLVGMALGGWLSGVVYDITGTYRAAFIHGVVWNLLNVSIVVWLLLRHRRAVAGLPKPNLSPA